MWASRSRFCAPLGKFSEIEASGRQMALGRNLSWVSLLLRSLSVWVLYGQALIIPLRPPPPAVFPIMSLLVGWGIAQTKFTVKGLPSSVSVRSGSVFYSFDKETERKKNLRRQLVRFGERGFCCRSSGLIFSCFGNRVGWHSKVGYFQPIEPIPFRMWKKRFLIRLIPIQRDRISRGATDMECTINYRRLLQRRITKCTDLHLY